MTRETIIKETTKTQETNKEVVIIIKIMKEIPDMQQQKDINMIIVPTKTLATNVHLILAKIMIEMIDTTKIVEVQIDSITKTSNIGTIKEEITKNMIAETIIIVAVNQELMTEKLLIQNLKPIKKSKNQKLNQTLVKQVSIIDLEEKVISLLIEDLIGNHKIHHHQPHLINMYTLSNLSIILHNRLTKDELKRDQIETIRNQFNLIIQGEV